VFWLRQLFENQYIFAVPLACYKSDRLVQCDQYAMFLDSETQQICIRYLLMAEYPVTERFGND